VKDHVDSTPSGHNLLMLVNKRNPEGVYIF
jgi:hypothetical protein